MKNLLVTVALALLMCCSAFAKKTADVKVTFDKFKNKTHVSVSIDRANDGKITINGEDARVLVRRFEVVAALTCEGQTDKCTPTSMELLFVGATSDWSLKTSHIDFLIDGKPESIPADWDGQVLSGDDLREYIDSNPDNEFIVRLANAKRVDVKIGSFDFTLSEDTLAALRLLAGHITD